MAEKRKLRRLSTFESFELMKFLDAQKYEIENRKMTPAQLANWANEERGTSFPENAITSRAMQLGIFLVGHGNKVRSDVEKLAEVENKIAHLRSLIDIAFDSLKLHNKDLDEHRAMIAQVVRKMNDQQTVLEVTEKSLDDHLDSHDARQKELNLPS